MDSRPPLVTRCVTLGKSSTISGLGRPRGRLRAAQPSGDKPSGWWHQGSPHLGPGQLVAGAGRVAKETGHHPSRRPGSVLNCLLHEA